MANSFTEKLEPEEIFEMVKIGVWIVAILIMAMCAFVLTLQLMLLFASGMTRRMEILTMSLGSLFWMTLAIKGWMMYKEEKAGPKIMVIATGITAFTVCSIFLSAAPFVIISKVLNSYVWTVGFWSSWKTLPKD